jgi:hypothetical protein
MPSLIGVLIMAAPVQRDPAVAAAVAESRRVLAENAALVRELAAVERALVRQEWKKRRSTSR